MIPARRPGSEGTPATGGTRAIIARCPPHPCPARAATPDNDPALLNALPIAARVLAAAPARIKEALLAASHVEALCDSQDDQVTIRASLTADTIAAC